MRSLAVVGLCGLGLMLAVCTRAEDQAGSIAEAPLEIQCAGEFGGHLQGIATDRVSAVYWTFTITLVKTDLTGNVLKTATSLYHLGDLTYHDGKVYVAACLVWDRPNASSKVYVYDADDLALLERKSVPEVRYGAGGIEYYNGHFFIVGGIAEDSEENCVYEYDGAFDYVTTHKVPSGNTSLGVQAISHFDGHFWLGCYGDVLLKLDDSCSLVAHYRVDCGYGVAAWRDGDVLVARTPYRIDGNTKRWRGVAHLAHTDPARGLVFYEDVPKAP